MLIRHGRSLSRGAGAAFALALVAGGGAPAHAQYGVRHYPSYFPEEIRIEIFDPTAAAGGLEEKTLHAYLGAAPGFSGRIPDHVKPIESLGSFLVLSVNPASEAAATADERCRRARGFLARLRAPGPGVVVHPYPVTPYHADYLHHLDRIEDAKAAVAAAPSAAAPLVVEAAGSAAEALASGASPPGSGPWDVRLEEVPASRLLAAGGRRIAGALESPWAKEGWVQAHRLLAPAVADPGRKKTVAAVYGQLMAGEYLDFTERVNLERRLLAALTGGCERLVAGYTVRREYINDDFTAGIENIAYDSQLGMNSLVFVRTVKLKDYPWNGSLHLGLRHGAEAAWNPVAGFTDPAGRLIWSAVGDPALLPFPDNSSWIPNRLDFAVTRAKGQSGGVKVPADALRPEPGTGALRPVGERTFASAKVVYQLVASPFHDGTETEIADLLYPLILTYRWGAVAGAADAVHEPALETALAALSARIVGVRPVRVDETVKYIDREIHVKQKVPVIELYLRDTPGDTHQVAALAPPWSTVPWHVLALMEDAVARGHAAFSRNEAARRGVRWLDLVRDPSLGATLLEMVREFEQAGYRPDALKDLVTADQARTRWFALRTFAEKRKHFLVTNGPYWLKDWSAGAVVLKADREMTYPLGFGSYDRYVHPPRAVIRTIVRDGGRAMVEVDAEKVVKVQRHYEVVREPLTRSTSRGLFGVLVVSRYLLIGPDGTVVSVDKMHWRDDNRFEVTLPERLPPGRYALVAAVFLDGNSLIPSAGVLRFNVGPSD